MKQFNYTWLRIIAPAALMVASLIGNQAFQPPLTRLKLVMIIGNCIAIALVFEVIRAIIFYIRKKFPLSTQLKKRLTYTIAFSVLATFLITVFSLRLMYAERKFSWVTVSISNFMQSILIVMLTVGAYEAIYFYQLLVKSEKEKEELLRANLQSQFDSLKGQVNPHFLFNSLNTLSSLIAKDPVKAEDFVVELSSVYRYLLKSNEGELTTLSNELAFIHSFLHLLKTRFANGLEEEIKVDEKYLSCQLPPLTLQMLVENAVKHNIIASAKPLKICIRTTADGKLEVKNNLQKKTQQVPSGKVGLANIISRYRLLKQPDVTVDETSEEFIVTVPLIKTATYEGIYN